MLNVFRRCSRTIPSLVFALVVGSLPAVAQSTASLQGAVTDQTGAVVPGAKIVVHNQATGVERTTQADHSGNYLVPALPVGTYTIEIRAEGFQAHVVKDIVLEVGQRVVEDFQLKVGAVSQAVTVTGETPLLDTATVTVGQVINQRTVQEIPLNGRHFLDLGMLIPGSVTPPQTGFLSAPLRGQGFFGFNTAGGREDTVNFMINGINLNDMVQNQITFQPSINTVSEFKADNSTYSAEYGRSSGAIVNIATRSGTNDFHGEAFDFLRNDQLDARNFFAKTVAPFKRNQFGAAVGGPIRKNRTFFFFSWESLRHRQGLTINSGVLSNAQRAKVADPTVSKLLGVIPTPNAVGARGEARFIGSALAPVNIDQWTGDVSHLLSDTDRLHGYYAFQRDRRQESTAGTSIPGFGDTRQARRQIFTLNETHTFGPTVVNEARLGFNRIHITFIPNAHLNPVDFGINDSVNTPIGLPSISVGGLGLVFGGPGGEPQGRGDTTGVLSDSLTYLRGRHSLKFGGEVRRFYNNNFNLDTGSFSFANVDAFLAGSGNFFSITSGSGASRIATGSLGAFAQDNFRFRPNLSFELGLRYDWNMSPLEALGRFVVFDPRSASLAPVGGSGIERLYNQNDRNVQPRIGFTWDPFKNGKTSIRGAYAWVTDQPVTNMDIGPTVNPPFATPLTFVGAVTFANAIAKARAPGSLSPANVNRNFRNAYVQSWNLNLQRQMTSSLALMVGYFGSKGTHLRITQNINQFVNSVRPFPALAATSPILPGTPLGNIGEIDSGSNSSYNALWISANKRLGHGLQFNTSYTWSKSIDDNSRNSAEGVILQDSFNVRSSRGLSEFDARNRFVINWVYELPFRGHRLIEGWEISGIAQAQSGNPVFIRAGNPLSIPGTTIGGANIAAFTGVASIRPDQSGAIRVIGKPNQWFANAVCDPRDPKGCPAGSAFALPVALVGGKTVFHFGSLGRNVVRGPDFTNLDFSILKNTRLTERLTLQFRAEFFDILNHANFGQPGGVAQLGSTSFGVITSTRFPTGDSGSSRQVQFALKLMF